MISDEINRLIEQAKQHKNGQSRNKVISHLVDARANAFVLEREEFMDDPKPTALTSIAQAATAECICPMAGVISKNCPALIHKQS